MGESIGRNIGCAGRQASRVVTRASATLGAKSLGTTIPGNMVVGVTRPDFAIRMLEASVPAGIEAPIRFYITENEDGTATLGYKTPSAVFAPYADGGFPRLSDGPMLLDGAQGLRCPASPRHALLAENLGKPSLWVIISEIWYYCLVAKAFQRVRAEFALHRHPC